jgi:hypothetical protein
MEPVRDGYSFRAVIDRVAFLGYPLVKELTQVVGSRMSFLFRKRNNGHSPPTALHRKANGKRTTQQHRCYCPEDIAILDALIHQRAKELGIKPGEPYVVEKDRACQEEMDFAKRVAGIDVPMTYPGFDDVEFGTEKGELDANA